MFNLNSQSWNALLGTAAVISAMTLSGPAQAATLGPVWSLTMDSFSDGTDYQGATGSFVGGKSNYEIYGMAMKAEKGFISVAFNANMDITGQAHNGARNNNIGWGDLFFNFSGKSFKDAEAAGQLYGVRFAGSNDSGISSTGVFSNAKTQSVMQYNSGYTTVGGYQNRVPTLNDTSTGNQGVVGYGDLSNDAAKSYLTSKTVMKTITETIEVPVQKTRTKTIQVPTVVPVYKTVKVNGKNVQVQTGTKTVMQNKKVTETYTVMEKRKVQKQVPVSEIQDNANTVGNVMASGNKVGDISMLGVNELLALGDMFKQQGGIGKYTFGFSFAESLLPKGDSIASILLECMNDGLIAKANIVEQSIDKEVPEPITMSGLLLAGAGLASAKRRQKAQKTA